MSNYQRIIPVTENKDSSINQEIQKFLPSPFMTLIKHPYRSLRQMIDPLIKFLKKINDYTLVNYKSEFSSFVPGSAGASRAIKRFTKNEINGIFQVLERLINTNPNIKGLTIISFEEYLSIKKCKISIEKSGQIFKDFGTNKHKPLHKVYDFLSTRELFNVLEIGIGTNNKNIVSYMPGEIKPGSSLRSFDALFIQANIFGADFDRSILFSNDSIKTQFVDQLNYQSLVELFPNIKFDLIIDDGFHSPRANINTLMFALQRLEKEGILVIEDVSPKTFTQWNLVSALLQPFYNLYYIEEDNYNYIIIEQSNYSETKTIN
jgi:hypothetical protein